MYIKTIGILHIYGLSNTLKIEVNVKNANAIINTKKKSFEMILKSNLKK
jgi:hypothetical protein